MCCFAYAMGGLGFLRSRWSIVDVRGVRVVDRGGNGVGESFVECPHMGPALLAILLRSAVWHVGPHYPRACARGFAGGSPILCVGERLVEAEVGWWRAVKMRNAKDEAGLSFVEDGCVR